MDIVTLCAMGLATWRVSLLLVREAGPFFIFQRLRELAGITHDLDGSIVKIPDRFFSGLISCVWCTSIWVAGGWVLLWFFLPKASVLAADIFALSSLTIALDRLFTGHNSR